MFHQLSSANLAAPFDGMAVGDFVDMYGRSISIKREELEQYVANTKANLGATRDAAGNIVGLPIDTLNHDKGIAAGWIVDVSIAEGRDVLTFAPRWNETGRALIMGDELRYFSPTFDPRNKVILGGSLTNWPATKDAKEKRLLKPISMAELATVSDESFDEKSMKVRRAFSEATRSYYVWAVEVFPDYLIAYDDDDCQTYKVPYTESEDGLTFSARSEWVEVKQAWVEMAFGIVRDFINRAFAGRAETMPEPAAKTTEEKMTIDFSKMSTEERSAAATALLSGSNPPAELAALVKSQAEKMAAELLAVEQRKLHVADLASALVGGTAESKRGLPLDKAELAGFLLNPTPEVAERFLSAIQAKGLVEFGELGHSREEKGQHELPAEFAEKLDSGGLTLSDLANPILALGDLSQYNLSKWQKEQAHG
jgi:hypothetical protein